MGTCPIGYHVKDASVVGYVHTYVNGSHLQCVRCTVDDGVTCDQICAPGRSSIAPPPSSSLGSHLGSRLSSRFNVAAGTA